jgi:hypothetical protein
MSKLSLGLTLVAPAMLAASLPSRTAENVQLTVLTLHAASLTTPTGAGDSTDTPFIVATLKGAHLESTSVLHSAADKSLRTNEQLGARPLAQLSLNPGDSVEVLLSVLENSKVRTGDSLTVAAVEKGARVVGRVSLMVTNEAGSIYWRKAECVESCKVLNGPVASAVSATNPAGAVIELSGNGGTYHLALRAQ